MGDKNPIRTLGDYSKPSHEGYRNTIELPTGNNVIQFFYDHVNPITRRTIDQSAGGKLCDLNAEESWALLEDLALYDNEGWNNPRDFAKPVKAIALPQDVPSTSYRRLIELENQFQSLMEAYLASTQLTQVNKITASCEIWNGPHDSHDCIKGPKQACVDYASSHTNEIRGKRFISNQGPRNFNDATNDDMIGKINLLWKTVSKKLNDISTSENARNSMAHKSIAVISRDEKEELKKKGIKSPSKFDTKEEDTSFTNAREHELGNMVRRSEEVKKHKKKEDEMETNMEVEDVIKEEESEFEMMKKSKKYLKKRKRMKMIKNLTNYKLWKNCHITNSY
ncbi:hypothetical protein Tco_1294504 [Tanacetum coccineum]